MVSNYVLLAATPFHLSRTTAARARRRRYPREVRHSLLGAPHPTPWLPHTRRQHLRRRCSAHPQVLPRLRAAGGDGGRSLLCSGSCLQIRPALAVRTAPAAPHPRQAGAPAAYHGAVPHEVAAPDASPSHPGRVATPVAPLRVDALRRGPTAPAVPTTEPRACAASFPGAGATLSVSILPCGGPGHMAGGAPSPIKGKLYMLSGHGIFRRNTSPF
jgi:hypothetical protein